MSKKTKLQTFIMWLHLNGYYVGCYGEVIQDKEVEKLLEEFGIFFKNYDSSKQTKMGEKDDC